MISFAKQTIQNFESRELHMGQAGHKGMGLQPIPLWPGMGFEPIPLCTIYNANSRNNLRLHTHPGASLRDRCCPSLFLIFLRAETNLLKFLQGLRVETKFINNNLEESFHSPKKIPSLFSLRRRRKPLLVSHNCSK